MLIGIIEPSVSDETILERKKKEVGEAVVLIH